MPTDRDLIREAIRAYEAYRKARGFDPRANIWRERVTRDLAVPEPPPGPAIIREDWQARYDRQHDSS